MSEHPIEGMMSVTMQKIRDMVDVNTIIGQPITSPDGTIVIPVSKVSFGFASGGSDIPTAQPKQVFGGLAGAGVTIQPLAFLVINNGNVKLMHMNDGDGGVANGLVSMVPEVIDKISGLFSKDKSAKVDTVDSASAASAASAETSENADSVGSVASVDNTEANDNKESVEK